MCRASYFSSVKWFIVEQTVGVYRLTLQFLLALDESSINSYNSYTCVMFVSYLIISGFEECNFTKIFSNVAHSNSNAPFSQETCMHIQHWKQSNTAPMKPIFIVCQYRLLLLNLLLRFFFVDFCPTDLFSKMLSYAYLMMKNKNLLVVLSLKFMKKNSDETVQLDFCVGERKF